MPKRSPSFAIHPVAALFPMLPDDELDDLAADIRERGLLQPLTLSADGRFLLDGRNRLAACERAGVEPAFVHYDGNDLTGFIIGANVHRRHLTKGQRAMAIVQANSSPRTIGQTNLASEAETSRTLIARALVVQKWAPELADQVLNGGSLDQAYEIAAGRKRQHEQDAQVFAGLRTQYPTFTETLQQQVEKGELPLAQALAQVQVLAETERARLAVRAFQDRIQLMVEEIGPEASIRATPDLDVSFNAPPPDPPRALREGLEEQERLLQRLGVIKRDLDFIAREKPKPAVWWMEGYVKGVRAAITQIVDSAYAIAEAHNALLNEPPLRRVR
jgi:ParB-like chromosome segregation protein Spo0J